VALAPERLAARLPPGTVLVGDAADAYPEMRGPGVTHRSFATHHPRGGVVAELGARLLAAGQAVDVGTVEPAYLRQSEAEITHGMRKEEPAGAVPLR
jgi:hypothetical protein